MTTRVEQPGLTRELALILLSCAVCFGWFGCKGDAEIPKQESVQDEEQAKLKELDVLCDEAKAIVSDDSSIKEENWLPMWVKRAEEKTQFEDTHEFIEAADTGAKAYELVREGVRLKYDREFECQALHLLIDPMQQYEADEFRQLAKDKPEEALSLLEQRHTELFNPDEFASDRRLQKYAEPILTAVYEKQGKELHERIAKWKSVKLHRRFIEELIDDGKLADAKLHLAHHDDYGPNGKADATAIRQKMNETALQGSKGVSTRNVVLGMPSIEGELEVKPIQRVVKEHLVRLAVCHQEELEKDSTLSGHVVSKVTVSPTGEVMSATVSESSLKNRDVESCVTRGLRQVEFPEANGAGITVIRYPMEFKSMKTAEASSK